MIQKEVFIKDLINNKKIICKPEINDIVNAIIKEYKKHDIYIGELLPQLSVCNASVEDVAIIYARVYKIIENDKVVRIADNDKINLSDDCLL